MNFNIYNVLGICTPVAALFLLFLIANVVGFLKDHWEKARCYIGFLIFDIPLAAAAMAGARLFVKYIQNKDFSKCIVIVMWLVLVEVILLYIRVNFLNRWLNKAHQGKAKGAVELRDYLEEPVNDFPWLRVYTEEENRRGLLALRELAQRIRKKQGYCYGNLSHIFTAERALAMGQYSLACHELLDVVHFYQTREVTTLIYKMLEPYLNEVTPVEQAAKRKCCPRCGNQCQDKDRYCRICGERLFKRFPELSEKDQAKVTALIEHSIDACLVDKDETEQRE